MVLLLSLFASPALAADVLVPEATPASMSDFSVAFMVYGIIAGAIENKGLDVQDGDEIREWAGDAADACADIEECPGNLWSKTDAELAVVLSIGQAKGGIAIEARLYGADEAAPIKTIRETIPGGGEVEFSKKLAKTVADMHAILPERSAPKKSSSKKAVAVEEEEEEAPKATFSSKYAKEEEEPAPKKKAPVKVEEEEDDTPRFSKKYEEEEEEPAPKKKAPVRVEEEEEEDTPRFSKKYEEEEEEAPKKSSSKSSSSSGSSKSSKSSTAVKIDEDLLEDFEDDAPKKKSSSSDEFEDDLDFPSKSTAKSGSSSSSSSKSSGSSSKSSSSKSDDSKSTSSKSSSSKSTSSKSTSSKSSSSKKPEPELDVLSFDDEDEDDDEIYVPESKPKATGPKIDLYEDEEPVRKASGGPTAKTDTKTDLTTKASPTTQVPKKSSKSDDVKVVEPEPKGDDLSWLDEDAPAPKLDKSQSESEKRKVEAEKRVAEEAAAAKKEAEAKAAAKKQAEADAIAAKKEAEAEAAAAKKEAEAEALAAKKEAEAAAKKEAEAAAKKEAEAEAKAEAAAEAAAAAAKKKEADSLAFLDDDEPVSKSKKGDDDDDDALAFLDDEDEAPAKKSTSSTAGTAKVAEPTKKADDAAKKTAADSAAKKTSTDSSSKKDVSTKDVEKAAKEATKAAPPKSATTLTEPRGSGGVAAKYLSDPKAVEQRARLGVPWGDYAKFKESGLDEAAWLKKANVHAGRAFIEVAGGYAIGDVDRGYGVRVALDGSLDVVGQSAATGAGAGAGAMGRVAVGYAPAWFIDTSVAFGLQTGRKYLNTGWECEDACDPATFEDTYPAVDASQLTIEPRVRAYPVATGLVKPYAVAGFHVTVFDSFHIPDENQVVKYPDAEGGAAFGPTVGLGVLIDPVAPVSVMLEVPFTLQLNDGSYANIDDSLTLEPQVLDKNGWILRFVGGVSVRL